MSRRVFLPIVAAVALVALAIPAGSAAGAAHPGAKAAAMPQPADPLSQINHIVVIYEENHSFDNLYGMWPGVNGLRNTPTSRTAQINQAGKRYDCLLQDDANLASPPLTATCTDSTTPTTFQSHFGNAPFRIDSYIAPTDTTCPPTPSVAFTHPNGWVNGTGSPGGCTRDIVHRFYQEQYQLNGGHQNRYVTGSDAAGLTMGYYDTTQLPIYQYLHQAGHPNYAILDDFFQAAFGGSFLNHQWLIAAATPTYPGAAATLHSVLDANGMPVLRSPPASNSPVALYTSPASAGLVDGPLTQTCPATNGLACGDYAVNTMQPFAQPSGPFGAKLPAQTAPTIGDRLTAAGVDWAWYAGGWSNAAGDVGAPGWTNGAGPDSSGNCPDPNSFKNPAWPFCPDQLFQFHHQPFSYYANYGPTGPGRSHLRDEQEFISDAQASTSTCQLKPVSFVKPIGEENEHPGYASEPNGSDHLVSLLQDIQGSACASDTMVVVTYDEFGGQWDHVPPPGMLGTQGPHDQWGPGTRIPALVITPGLRGSFVVDGTEHDTTSILSTIEHRFGLPPLSTRDAAVPDLSSVFGAKSAGG
ncbi:MAG TPA: alkaline phosphatase family protein [Actinomycetota bacterium]|nr:alkaline phosphatase family protein [Actinomycetota bacterium]